MIVSVHHPPPLIASRRGALGGGLASSSFRLLVVRAAGFLHQVKGQVTYFIHSRRFRMKTSIVIHRSFRRAAMLAVAFLFLFIGLGQANPLEELRDIFTKDRSNPPAQEQSTGQQPVAQQGTPNDPFFGDGFEKFKKSPEERNRQWKKRQEQRERKAREGKQTYFAIPWNYEPGLKAGLKSCYPLKLDSTVIGEDGNIYYVVRKISSLIVITRLAGNIKTPAGQGMLQMLLSNTTYEGKLKDIRVGARYPAGYDCDFPDLTVPATYLWIYNSSRQINMQ